MKQASVGRPVTLTNPGRVKKRLTWKQKLHFGTKRQRAAAKMHVRNPKRSLASIFTGKSANRKTRRAKSGAQAKYHFKRHLARKKARSTYQSNVGEIITIRPLPNTGKSKSHKRKGYTKNKGMASTKAARRRAGLKAARTRARRKAARSAAHRTGRRRNPGGYKSHRRRTYRRRRSNPGMALAPLRRRRRNAGIRHHRRKHYGRRNPGMMSGTFGQALGIIGGAFVTKLGTSFLPASLNSGIPGYIITALIAMLQGKAVGKLLKNPKLGQDMVIGGYVYLALRIASDYFPSLSLPFGLSGMGVIGPSSFWTPQVPLTGSMGSFVQPQMLRAAIPMQTAAGMRGLGTTRRVGRMR